MPAVLFVCTQNQFRSPLAAAMFQKCLAREVPANGWKVASAGTWTVSGIPAHPAAMQVANEFGLSLIDHRSRPVSAALLSWADLVLVMETGHLEAIQIEFAHTVGRAYMLSEIVDDTRYDIPDFIDRKGRQNTSIGIEVCEMVERGFYKIYDLAERLCETSKYPDRSLIINQAAQQSGFN